MIVILALLGLACYGLAMSEEWQALPKKAPDSKQNPTTPAKVELGKKLFFDPRLSKTGTVSCNSCHNLMEGGDDGRPSSMGIHGRLGPRNAPTVWNSAFQTTQFWDGRAPTLEEQAKGPLVASVEMGMPSHDIVMKRLKTIPAYQTEFQQVFGGKDAVTIDHAVKAIAAFERTLITPDSPYDLFAQGKTSPLSAKQKRGLKVFESVGCVRCHSGPAFNGWSADSESGYFQTFPRYTDNSFVKTYGLQKDVGRFQVTRKERDKHKFKVPTLRNITLTAPYFHNGSVPTLREAVQVMAVTQLDEKLAAKDLDDIVAFLGALEGKFPEITLPRLPSRSGYSVLENQEPATIPGVGKKNNGIKK